MQKNNHLLETPTIKIANKQWPIPPITARTNRMIDPLILSLLPIFAQPDFTQAIQQLQSAQYEALQDIVFHALRQGHPELTRDAFLDMAITLPELVAAFAVIAEQTGIFVRESPAGDISPGE